MSFEIERLLDDTGWQLLQELQQNARLSYSELGQRVGLSSPAVADRMRRMEEAGIISAYRAEVNLPKLGLPVLAVIRLGSHGSQSCTYIASQVSEIPEVLACYRVSGTDAVVLLVAAASVDHLGRIVDQLSLYGLPTTSLVFSKPYKRHVITRDLIERGEEWEEIL